MKAFRRFLIAGIYTAQLLVLPLRAEAPASIPALTGVHAEGSQVTLDLTQLLPYDVFTLQSPWRLVVEIPGAVYQAGVGKKEVTSTLVRRIRGYQFKENPLITRVVVDLKGPVDYKTTAGNNQVVISLTKNDIAGQTAEAEAAPKKQPVNTAVARKKDLLATLPKEQVTLDFENADIRDVVRLMAETSNINMIYGPEVGGTISIHLRQVPFDEAFNTIMNLKGLVAEQLGANILRITTPDILQKERQKAITYTKNIPINYLKADDIQKHIQAMIQTTARKGTVSVVNESNSIVLTDSEEGIAQAERLIAQLDKRPRQVMIEARIVEVNLTNGFDMGVQWEFANQSIKTNPDGSFKSAATLGGISANETRITHTITNPDGTTTELGAVTPPNGTGVSLAGPTGAAIAFGFLKPNSILDVTLSALINESKAKVLSAPKVVTINGQLARIQAVQDIPFRTSVVSNGVVTEDFKTVSAGIILEVTPTINAEDRITLKIRPESSFPVQQANNQDPIIRTRSAQTTVIIRDGETLVIGGLIDEQDNKGINKVPILGDIPLIGAFFRSETNSKTRNELLVFVTPRIVRD